MLDKGLQHRRHEVQRRHAFMADRLDEPRRIAVRARRRHHQLAPTISGQKNSHTETSKLNGVFCSTTSSPVSP